MNRIGKIIGTVLTLTGFVGCFCEAEDIKTQMTVLAVSLALMLCGGKIMLHCIRKEENANNQTL